MPKPEKFAVALNVNKFNKNSFIAIIRALEKENETEKIPIYILDAGKEDRRMKLFNLAGKYEKMVFM